MFRPFAPDTRVHLGVVALGVPDRLVGCVRALVDHGSRHDFAVSVLINGADDTVDQSLTATLPDGVHVQLEQANLGWAGGLHRLRALGRGELFVFVQDDMLPEPGWLDALVDAADAHPEVAAFGGLRVDADGKVLLHNGGRATPFDDVRRWNASDTTDRDTPTSVTVLDWVTSKGMLIRTSVFDDVGGPDPSVWPLHHVDKDISTHLRCHGHQVALVPNARLQHAQSQSAPNQFRQFMGGWRDAQFHAKWTSALQELAERPGPVAHPCAHWRELSVDAVEAAAGREATRMLVPFARFAAQGNGALAQNVGRLEDAVVAQQERRRRRVRRLRREVRRLQRELDLIAEKGRATDER